MTRKKMIFGLLVTVGLMLAASGGKQTPAEQELTILNAGEYGSGLRSIVPQWDSNRVWTGATANLTRKTAIGYYFKGAADDTLRIVSVQSGGTRYLVIATDTTSAGFGKEKFRIDTSYSFTSGSTAYALAVGNVDGDEYTDILAGHSATPFRLIWFEWDGAIWAARDSFAVNAAINDITIGDADNNGVANEIFLNIAQTSPNSAIMRAVWNGASWDTTRILLTGTIATRGVAIGDVRPDQTGNEVYAVGSSRMWMVHYNGATWDTTLITTAVAGSYDVVVGDINPATAGNEIGVVHGSTSYQISVWTWTGTTWSGTLWVFTSTWGTTDNTIAFGDVLSDNPGNELVLTGGASTAAVPRVFWIMPNGAAWVSSLPKPVASQSDYGVAIGNVNRWRNFNQEMVISGGGSLVEIEQHEYANDGATFAIRMANPIAIINMQDTVRITIYNPGNNAISGFSVGYRFKTSPITGTTVYAGTLNPGAFDSVQIPVTMDWLGLDTLYAFTSIGSDLYALNDTTKLHIELYDDSTRAASGFNATLFPPGNSSYAPTSWARTIVSGTYNWNRYTAGTSPTCTPLEGYGMAGYPSYSASSGQQARLRTHRFSIGPDPKKVMLRFFMYHDPGYTSNPDSVIIEYSYNDTAYVTAAAFHRYNAVAAWYVHDVEVGDFPANRDIYVAFRARSGYGNNMFIDSARIYVTQVTGVPTDAGIQSISPFPQHFVGDSLDVAVTVRNYGYELLTSTPVFYTLGTTDTVFETWTGSLNSNQTAVYTFTQKFAPSQPGNDTLYAGTRLVGDMIPANDTTHLAFVTSAFIDAGIQSISPFPVPNFVGDSLDVTVVVRNYGLDTLFSIPIFFTLGAVDTVSETWIGSLPSLQTASYTFTQKFVPVQPGNDTLYAGTRLPGDESPVNDTTHLAFNTCPFSYIPPYTKDFNESWTNSTNPPFCGWRIVDGGDQTPPVVDNNDWHRYAVTTPARNVARIYYSPIEWSDDWLISPRFDCSQLGSYTLRYWHYYNDYATATLDSGRVLLSTDDGATWQTLQLYSNADDSGYKNIDVSSLVMGQNDIRCAFHYVANNEYWWYIDDFVLDFAPDLSGPTITFVEQPQNTYANGPYIVRATITDLTGIQADSLYYLVNDNLYAVTHTSVSGDTFTFSIPTQAPGTIIEYHAGAVDLVGNSAVTSSYQFWMLSPLAPSNLTVTGQVDSTTYQEWLPPAEEINYAGGPAYYWTDWLAGDMIATQFTPQYYPCQLQAATFMFYSNPGDIELHVWADDGSGNPGASLYIDTVTVANLYPSYEIFDLSGAGIQVASGDFHIGLAWLAPDTPTNLSDDSSYSTRNKANTGSGWVPVGYDWIISSLVSYLPGAKKILAKPMPVMQEASVQIPSRLKHTRIHNLISGHADLLRQLFNLDTYQVERSETQGGPYSPIGTTDMNSFVDSTVLNEYRYYYTVTAVYTTPDSISYYSNEVNIGVDFNGPLYTNTTYDSASAGPWVIATDITDWIGLGFDSLAYRTDGGAWSFAGSDSVNTATYYYTIPDFPAGTFIEFYMFSQDSSWWRNASIEPASGYYSFVSQTGISELRNKIPMHVFMTQTPNPFAKRTTIAYGIPRQTHVNISIYNAIGQIVNKLVDGQMEPGSYSILWNGSDDNQRTLSKGIYFLRMKTDDTIITRKLILTQ